MIRDVEISGFPDFTHRRKNCLNGCIALRCRRNIGRCLRKNNLRLRHSDSFHGKRCADCNLKCLRIGVSDILRRTDHNPSRNKGHTLSRRKHSGQIINRRVRIGAPHAFDKRRNRVVMVVTGFIVAQNLFLNTLSGHLKRNVNHFVIAPGRG